MKGNLRRFIGRLESCITPWKIFYGVTVKKKVTEQVTEQYFPVVILITKVKQRRRRRRRQRKWQKGPQ